MPRPSPTPTRVAPFPSYTPIPVPTSTPRPTPVVSPTGIVVNNATFDSFNPLKIENSAVAGELSQPGTLFSRTLSFLFPMAGLILFVMLIAAGFEIMGGAATKKSIDSGKQRATAAIVGFLLLFASYWIIQIVQIVFNINILGK